MKHAGGGARACAPALADDALEVEVADDGRGPPPAAAGGHGLIGMRERVRLYGGTSRPARVRRRLRAARHAPVDVSAAR